MSFDNLFSFQGWKSYPPPCFIIRSHKCDWNILINHILHFHHDWIRSWLNWIAWHGWRRRWRLNDWLWTTSILSTCRWRLNDWLWIISTLSRRRIITSIIEIIIIDIIIIITIMLEEIIEGSRFVIVVFMGMWSKPNDFKRPCNAICPLLRNVQH